MLAAAPGALVAAATQPEKRVWQVGTKLVRPTDQDVVDFGAPSFTGYNIPGSGLKAIEGQPGLFRDMSTGQVVNIRDFRESDKFSTIEINAEPSERVSFQQVAGRAKRDGLIYDEAHHMKAEHFIHDEYLIREHLPEGEITLEFPEGGQVTFHAPKSELLKGWDDIAKVGNMELRQVVEQAFAQGVELHIGLVKKAG